MRWLFGLPFIVLGAFLISLTIDQMGNTGHIIMKIFGVGCFCIAGVIVKGKRESP